VNNSLYEGLSIQLVEGVCSGLAPLVASVDLHKLYFGDANKNWKLHRGFYEYCKLSDRQFEALYDRAKEALEIYFADYRTDYEVFLNECRY